MEYRRRVEEVQQGLRQEIIGTAAALFVKNGIGPVKMTDVAAAAGVGVATLYRWFGTKKELVLRAGVYEWQQAAALLEGIFTGEPYRGKTGYEQCSDLLKLFLAAYLGHPEFVRFLHEFDRFVEAEHIPPAALTEYEAGILDLQTPARQAYAHGLADGTVRPLPDFDTFYFSAAHALMALAQKLVCAGGLLPSDARVAGEVQLRTVIEMFLAYLRPLSPPA